MAQVSADAANAGESGTSTAEGLLLYRALVDLNTPYLDTDGQRHALAAGMQVSAEMKLGDRSVLEYLLSPIRQAFQEAGRER